MHWYLLSNQLALLQGIDFNFGIESGCEEESLAKALQLTRERIRDNVNTCAFYDRNDLLGYMVPEKVRDIELNPVNIMVPQVESSFLNILSNPDKAHRGARMDEYVSYIITHGWNGDPETLPHRSTIKSKIQQ